MKKEHIDKLESQLENLIEGAFTSLFGKRIRAQDIALRLARAMEDHLMPSNNGDPRPLAPDQYVIAVHPQTHITLKQKHPHLANKLCDYLVELATNADYQLAAPPKIQLLADTTIEINKLHINAGHSSPINDATAAMQPIQAQPSNHPPHAHLIINDNKTIPLTQPLINIGRNQNNHIVIDDPYVSRHHAQIRLRFGTYVIFNASSKTGTFVNGVAVKEHPLKSGDVIRIGHTQIVYMQNPTDETGDGTAVFDPL